MSMFFSLSSILLIFLLAGSSYGHFTGKGHVHRLSESRQVFLNHDCELFDTCDLKRFTLTTSVYEVWFSDDPNHPTYGNGVIMEYQTESVGALVKYAVVQFIKGCVFHTSRTGEGKINTRVGDTVRSFGEDIPFCFPQWVIDSQDRDPVYNSDPQYGRFYLLRWNKPGSYDNRTQKFFGAQKPETPVVYLADNPDGAFVTGTGVKNVTLEFNTCIYKASDVPLKTRRDDINFARPITCFEWQNVYVYDFDEGRFQTTLADLPEWEWPRLEPAARADQYLYLYLLVISVTLFIATALITFSQLGKLLRQRSLP